MSLSAILFERFGANESVARLVASITHTTQVRVEPHELAALAAVMSLVDRHMAERAAREGTIAEAVCQT